MATREPGRGTATDRPAGGLRGEDVREPPPERGGGGNWVLWAVVAIVVIGLAVWIVLAAVDDDESAGPEAGATVSGLVEEPGEFLGQTVTVSGNVESVLVTPGAFTLGENVDEGVVVVLPVANAQVPAELSEGETLQVTGTVSSVTDTTIEDNDFLFEETEQDDAFLDVFEGQPLITATQIDATVPNEQQNE